MRTNFAKRTILTSFAAYGIVFGNSIDLAHAETAPPSPKAAPAAQAGASAKVSTGATVGAGGPVSGGASASAAAPAPAAAAPAPAAPAPATAPAPAPAPAAGVAPAEAKPVGPTAEQVEAAKAAFTAGNTAYAAGDFATAEAEFRKAYALIPSPHAEFWIAESMDKANRPAKDVFAAYELFLSNPLAGHAGADRIASAEKRYSELKATLPATILFETTPAGASVSVDGKPQPGKTPLEIELPAGPHKIDVTLPGYEAVVVELEAEAGTHVRAPVELKVLPPPAPIEKATDVAPEAPQPEAHKKDLVPAYVTLGIGAAGLIAGGVFGILAIDAKSRFDGSPSTELADETERNALISDMAFGVAITLGITGIVLLTSDDEPTPKVASRIMPGRLVVAPWGGPTGGGAVAQMKF